MWRLSTGGAAPSAAPPAPCPSGLPRFALQPPSNSNLAPNRGHLPRPSYRTRRAAQASPSSSATTATTRRRSPPSSSSFPHLNSPLLLVPEEVGGCRGCTWPGRTLWAGRCTSATCAGSTPTPWRPASGTTSATAAPSASTSPSPPTPPKGPPPIPVPPLPLKESPGLRRRKRRARMEAAEYRKSGAKILFDPLSGSPVCNERMEKAGPPILPASSGESQRQ